MVKTIWNYCRYSGDYFNIQMNTNPWKEGNNMKNAKQPIPFLLATLLVASALISCGESTPSSIETDAIVKPGDGTTTEAITEPAPPSDGLEDIDMGGWELKICNVSPENLTWANMTILVDKETGDILDDAIFRRNSELCERFNMDIKVDDNKDVPSTIRKLVTAGDPEFSIYVCQEGQLSSYVPYTTDWSSIPHLSLDQPWWNPDATSVYNILDKQVALAGNMTLTAISRAVCMVFNKDIWKTYGNADINLYDLVTDNKWTLDKYLEISHMVKKDLNGDGVMDAQDLYGLNMGRGFKGYIASFLAGSGMNFTEKNADGENIFTLHQNERGLGLMFKLVDALSDDGYYYNEDTTCHSFMPADFFKNSHALFTQGVPHDIYKLRDMQDDIGILPMPKYDENQEKYYAAAWGGAVWTLSKTFDMEKAEYLGTALEAMSFATYRDIIPVYKEVALKTKTARDNESEKMLDIIFDSIYFDFGTNIMYDAVFAPGFLTSIWKKKSTDVIVSSIEKDIKKIDKYINDLTEAVKKID